MRWISNLTRRGCARSFPRTGRARRAELMVEGLESRPLMDGKMFTSLGGSGIVFEVVTHAVNGQEEPFARVGNGAIFEYNFAAGNFLFTGGYLDQIIPADGGIVGIAGGYLFSYRDGAGYTYLGGGGSVLSAVETHNSSGQEEVFARLSNGTISEYNFATQQFTSTGGTLNSLVADDTGITGSVNGYLFHYQDGGGYSYTGGSGIGSFVVSHNYQGQDVVFTRLASSNAISYYNYATSQWTNTGGYLNQMVATSVGITGTAQNYLFTYSFTGYYFTGGTNVFAFVVSHDPIGREELFIIGTNGTFLDYVISTHEWNTTGFTLVQFVADDTGIIGINSAGNLYHYQDPTTDFSSDGPDYLLRNSYAGGFFDSYEYFVPFKGIAMTGSNTGTVFLTILAAVPSLVGYDVFGTITITDSSSHFDYTEPFEGVYFPSNSYFNTIPAALEIQNLGYYGSYPPGGYAFRFFFLVSSSGQLTVNNSTTYNFNLKSTTSISTADDANGATSGASNATLVPTS